MQDGCRRGRPRDPDVDRALLLAARRCLARDGFTGMTIERVAADAGVSRPAVYRRFRSKEDLATAALAHLRAERMPPCRGRVRDDLRAVLRHFHRALTRPRGLAMIGTLLVEEQSTPELIALFRARVLQPRRRMLVAVLEAARERGEVAPDLDVEAATNLLVGSFYARYLVDGRVPRSWPDRVVATLWSGIAAG